MSRTATNTKIKRVMTAARSIDGGDRWRGRRSPTVARMAPDIPRLPREHQDREPRQQAEEAELNRVDERRQDDARPTSRQDVREQLDRDMGVPAHHHGTA